MRAWSLAVILLIGTTGASWASESLVDAVRWEHKAEAIKLIKGGADVDIPSVDGTTALHWAAYNDDVDLVKRLVDKGANPNARNNYNYTPMQAAAVVADPAVVKLLLKAGADPDSTANNGQTALMTVVRSGNVEAAKELLDHGAHVNAKETLRNQTALMWAAAKARPPMMALLIQYGADVNAQSKMNVKILQETDERRPQDAQAGGFTALLYAARENCVECAKALVAARADLNRPNGDGVTPLIVAINNFHFDMAKYLIEAGANVNKWDWWGRTPLYAAADMDTVPDGGREDLPSTDETTGVDIIKLLLAHGADPNQQLKLFPPYRHLEDDRGCDRILTIGATPLLRAAKVSDTPAVKALVDHGADVNLPNVNGVTPIMAAAGVGSVECDTRGGPAYLAPDVQKRVLATMKLLVAAGANVNAKDDIPRGKYFSNYKEQTALHGAAFWGWTDVVKYLVSVGAKIDAKDGRGLTPVDSAMGRDGTHGRGAIGGERVEVFPETAAALRDLCAKKPDCSLPPEPEKKPEKTAENL
jgi:ankyrin repeat protein